MRLLRRQHRGRLVEDQHLRPAVERLEDLDALLLGDGDVLDPRVRVDGEPVALGQLSHAFPRLREVDQLGAVRRLRAEHDVLGDGHHRDEHEVLVHHPDPAADRVLGGRELDLLPVQEDLALVGVVEPVEDVHQGRLAGAVLAEQRVHLALQHLQVDVVVRENAGELLGDPAKLEGGVSHAARS